MEQQHDILAALEAATRDPSCPLHFTPVRLRARIDGWTEARQRRFVAAIAATGSIGEAAALVGMAERTASRLCRRPDGASLSDACAAAMTLAKRGRRIRAAEAREALKGPKRPDGVFFPLQASTSTSGGPSAPNFGPSAPRASLAPSPAPPLSGRW